MFSIHYLLDLSTEASSLKLCTPQIFTYLLLCCNINRYVFTETSLIFHTASVVLSFLSAILSFPIKPVQAAVDYHKLKNPGGGG